MARDLAKLERKLSDAAVVLIGKQFGEVEVEVPFEEAARRPPMTRTRDTMIGYASAKNRKRFARLQSDYAWLKQCVAELGLNPEDAKFLL